MNKTTSVSAPAATNHHQDLDLACAQLLGQYQPGKLPLPVFAEIARLVRLPMVDLVPVRNSPEYGLEIGLVRRAASDRWWPGLWHLPGTVLRSDDTLDSALTRLKHEELGLTSCGQPDFVNFCIHQSLRGAEVVLLFVVQKCIWKQPVPIEWFELAKLPPDLVESERSVITLLQSPSLFTQK